MNVATRVLFAVEALATFGMAAAFYQKIGATITPGEAVIFILLYGAAIGLGMIALDETLCRFGGEK